MRNRTNTIIGVVMAIFAVVAVLVLFAPMFTIGKDFGPERGNGFGVIFGTAQNSSMHPVALLIVAFVIECVAGVMALVGSIFTGKIQGLLLGIASLLLIAGGVLFLLSVNLYKAANKDLITSEISGLGLGAAPITNAVFAFLAGLLGLYGAYSSFKA